MKIDKFVVTDVSTICLCPFHQLTRCYQEDPSKLEGGRNVKGMKSGQGDFGGCKMV